MKRVYTLLLTVLISGGWAFSQTPTSWTDNFDDNDLDTVAWKSLPGIYELAEANGELTITATKEDAWDGFFLKFPDKIDLSEHPYASLRIKADSSFDFRIYLWDENAEDTLYNKANADVWVVPGETYNTYYFNWSGKFMHSDVEGEFLYQDSTDIDGFLIDVDPGNSDLLYQGTIVFDDVIVGEGAEQPTANAEITSSAIGSVGATVVSDIPEGTVVSDLLGGLTANGGITMFAAGSPGKGGVEATGTDLLVSSMDIVVLLDGSNPKKYDVLVAPPSLPCYYRADFPTVDGEIDNVWETVPLVEMPYYYHDEVPEGPTDLGAVFRTLWDEVSIFFLVEVTDDVKKIDSPANLPYQDDCVEFWFDLNNSKNSSYLPSETDEYQVMFVRDNTNSHSVNHNDLIEGMDWAWKDTQGGYIFELEIPWLTSFKWMERYATTQPEFNQKLGFEVHVNDDDDDDPDRDLNVGWFNSIDEAWNDPSVLGDLKMMEEIYESVESLSSSMKFRIQPNPASDNLQLISTTGINSVEVINMIGQSVMNIQPRGERLVNLNIAELPGNIYLVKVKDQTGNVSTKKFVKK